MTYLKEIYDRRSYTTAANALGRTPSTLSIAIQKLEAEFGVRLFCKRGRVIEPTEACHRIMPIIEQTLEDVDKLISAAAGVPRQSLTVSLGLPQLLWFREVNQMKEDFAASGVAVNIRKSHQTLLEAALMQGQLDMAVLRKPFRLPDSFSRVYYRREVFCAYCPENSIYAAMERITPDVLASALVIISSELCDLVPLLTAYLKRHSASPAHLCDDTPDLHNAFSLARLRNGICIAPGFANKIENMTVRPIFPSFHTELMVVWARNAQTAAQQKKIAQYICGCLPREESGPPAVRRTILEAVQ